MGDEQLLSATIDSYRSQILEGIRALRDAQPFAAMTLACCAVDFLAHVIYEPEDSNSARAQAFNDAIRDWIGYEDAKVPKMMYGLRCGLVHEFRTAGDSGRVMISNEFHDKPFREHDVLTVSVSDFCDNVTAAFERAFSKMQHDDNLADAFLSRAFIHVQAVERNERDAGSSRLPEPRINDAFSAQTIPASGTGWFQPANDSQEFWAGIFESRVRQAKGNEPWRKGRGRSMF